MEKIFYIDDNFVDSRLDRWFKKNIFDVPQSLIEKNLRKGNIKVNKKKVKSSYKLKINDKITLYNIKFDIKKNIKFKYKPTKDEIVDSSNMIIVNNENFVVINKPFGVSVQSGTKSRKNILDMLSKTKEFNNFKPFPVHRIDKETTGLLIVAKNRKYAQLFTSLFRIRKIHKTYLGIVLGSFSNRKGTLIDDLFYYEGDKKVKVKAITHYSVIDSNNNYSLVKLNPETGRKHQLRKQLLMHGHPILGDSKYRIIQNNLKKTRHNKLMLHAYKINFSISSTKHNYTIDPPLAFMNELKERYLKIYQ
tara:strand:- start:188 stop:1102 length:915 start_codon:yes stop_codon:yes gene_type:complete